VAKSHILSVLSSDADTNSLLSALHATSDIPCKSNDSSCTRGTENSSDNDVSSGYHQGSFRDQDFLGEVGRGVAVTNVETLTNVETGHKCRKLWSQVSKPVTNVENFGHKCRKLVTNVETFFSLVTNVANICRNVALHRSQMSKL
jgi:hypothetical protein